MFAPDLSGGDGAVGVDETGEHGGFVGSGDDPEHAAGAVEDGEGKGHAPSPLVAAGEGDVLVGAIEDGVMGDEGGRMAVGAESEMDEVKHGWGSGELGEELGVVLGGGFEVGRFDGHGVEVVGGNRGVRE